MVFGVKDEIAPARISNKFAKDHENFKILGGIFENRFIEKDKVLALADLLSREELLQNMVGAITNPLSGFMNVLQGPIRGFVFTIKAVAEKQSNK